MMGKLRASPADSVGDLVVDFLASRTTESRLWPSDARLREAVLTLLCIGCTRGRLRMVLEAIETLCAARKARSSMYPGPDHRAHHAARLARTLAASNWRAVDAPDVRDRLVQTLGNLTLVNDRLNPSMSNGPWTSVESPPQSKRHGLSEHSVLLLNGEDLENRSDYWNENLVRQRSGVLLESIASVWQSPTATADTFTPNSLSRSVDPPPSTPHVDIEAEFARHLVTGIQQCQELGYNPTAFRTMMVEHGAVGAVQRFSSLRGPLLRWVRQAVGT